MAGDSNYQSVGLLLHCDGANGSTLFTDSSATPKTVTASGNAQISTAQSKFGGSSAYFDGAGDYVDASGGAEYDLGTVSASSNFTAEFWYLPGIVNSSVQRLLAHAMPGSGGDGRGGWSLYVESGVLRLVICATSNASNPWYYMLSTSSAVFTVGAWYHVAWVLSAGVPKLYINGIAVATTVNTSHAIYASTPIGLTTTRTEYGLRVGATFTDSGNQSPAQFLTGHVDDIRVTKAARYTANFTPPVEAFPNYVGALAGNVKNAAGANAARVVKAYRESTGGLVGSATSDATTGNYSIALLTNDAHTLIAYPAAGESLPALVLSGVLPV